MQRPKENGPHKCLLKLNRDFFLFQPAIDLAARLPHRHNFSDLLAALKHVVVDNPANSLAGQKRGDQGAGQAGTASRLLRKPQNQPV